MAFLRFTVRSAAHVFAAAALLASAKAQVQSVFLDLAGTWSGAGTISLMGGGTERLRCRAEYRPSDASHLSLTLRCASDSFKMEITSDVVRDGNHIAGSWREESVGMSGDLAGSARGEHIDATIRGMGTSGHLSMSVRGTSQSVTLTSQSQLVSGTASIVMRRE